VHPPTAHRTPHDSECCCLLARSAARKQTPHRAPERRPDAATSPCRPARDAFGPASRPSCCALHSLRRRRVRRVVMSPLFGATTHPPPLTGPRPPFNRLAALRKSGSEAFPEHRPSCRLCSGPGIRFAGYPAHHSGQHSAEGDHTRPQPSPQRTAVAIPKTGSLVGRPPCQMNSKPRSSPSEEPHPSSSFGLRRDK